MYDSLWQGQGTVYISPVCNALIHCCTYEEMEETLKYRKNMQVRKVQVQNEHRDIEGKYRYKHRYSKTDEQVQYLKD